MMSSSTTSNEDLNCKIVETRQMSSIVEKISATIMNLAEEDLLEQEK
jgi:hypothetical protein